MSLIKKSDVKRHLSPHHRKTIHAAQPVSQPDGTGFSDEDLAPTDPDSEVSPQSAPAIEVKLPLLVMEPEVNKTVPSSKSRRTQS